MVLVRADVVGLQADLKGMDLGDIVFVVDFDTECDGFLIGKIGKDKYIIEGAWETEEDGLYSTIDSLGENVYEKLGVTFNESILSQALSFNFPELEGGNTGFTYENLKSFSMINELHINRNHELSKYIKEADQ